MSSRWLCLKTSLAYLPLNIGVHFRRVATEGPRTFRLYVSIWFVFHVLPLPLIPSTARRSCRLSQSTRKHQPKPNLSPLTRSRSLEFHVRRFLTRMNRSSPVIETCSLPKCGIGVLIRRRKNLKT